MLGKTFFSDYREYTFLLVRYVITGLTAAAIQIVGMYVWISVLGMARWYWWGVVGSYTVALGIAFVLQKYWTFRNATQNTRRQFGWYTIISLGNLGLNALILAVSKTILESKGNNFFDDWYLIAQIAAVVICSAIGFIFNKYLTFREAL